MIAVSIVVSLVAIFIALIAINVIREQCYRCGKRDWVSRMDGFIMSSGEEEIRFYHKHGCKSK